MGQVFTPEVKPSVPLSTPQKVEEWIHKLSRAFNLVGLIVLAALMLLITCDVGGRYLLLSPIPGSLDFIQIMMAVMIFAGFAYCASIDGNVRVDVIYVNLSKRVQAFLDIITSALSVIIIALIAWQLGARVWRIILEPPGPATQFFEWPLMPFVLFAAVMTALLCLEFLIWFLHSIDRFIYGEKLPVVPEVKR